MFLLVSLVILFLLCCMYIISYRVDDIARVCKLNTVVGIRVFHMILLGSFLISISSVLWYRTESIEYIPYNVKDSRIYFKLKNRWQVGDLTTRKIVLENIKSVKLKMVKSTNLFGMTLYNEAYIELKTPAIKGDFVEQIEYKQN